MNRTLPIPIICSNGFDHSFVGLEELDMAIIFSPTLIGSYWQQFVHSAEVLVAGFE